MAKPYRRSHIPNFSRMSKEMRAIAVATANKVVKDFADRERDLFKERIEHQDFPAFRQIPPSPVTLARKSRLGLDMRTMIATGHYKDSIRVFFQRGRTPAGGTYRIGFHPLMRARDEHGKVAEILLSEVAAIQEFGSSRAGIPARPHWRPHLRDMERRATVMRQRLAGKILTAIKKKVLKAK